MHHDQMISQESLAAHHDGDVVLRDGSTVHIRVMTQADEAGLCAFPWEFVAHKTP
jgi:hypothetical protein